MSIRIEKPREDLWRRQGLMENQLSIQNMAAGDISIVRCTVGLTAWELEHVLRSFVLPHYVCLAPTTPPSQQGLMPL